MSFRDDTHPNHGSRVNAIAKAANQRLRDEPGYEIWFGLSQDRLWRFGGALAAVFVGLTTLGVLATIAFAVAS